MFRILSEFRLAQHVLRDWRSHVAPLSLLSIGLLYAVSPIDLIADSTPYIGHLDEFSFVLLGIVACRLGVGAILARQRRRSLANAHRAAAPPSAYAARDGVKPAGRETGGQINLGQVVLQPHLVRPPGEGRTIIISGLARGGTSMVAEIVGRAGIPLGDTADPVVHEDMELATALTHVGRQRLRRLVEQRNRQHLLWGLKLPNLHNRLTPWEMTLFRNPHVILVVRDPVAVAQRNVVSMHGNPHDQVVEAFRNLDRLGRFVRHLRVPVLLISYEKAVAKPEPAVASILQFCGIEVSPEFSAVACIQPENDAYLVATSLAEPPPDRPGIRRRIVRHLRSSARH